ncbi:MAG: hypothetical protein ACRDHZ_16700, partial [Ktedonobacteraceae bacterium]
MNIPAFNIKEIKPTYTKDAFIATIRPIRPIPFAMMNAPCCQMRQPPEEQKEHQQQTIQRTHMTAFPVPSATLSILECGSHPPAEPVLGNTSSPRMYIRNDDERFALFRSPKDAQLRFNRLVLP